MPDMFSANGNRLQVDTSGSYDPGITEEIDKQIRHLLPVLLYMGQKATDLKNATGSSNFEVITQNRPDTQRPRYYVAPKNRKGIHEELSQAVLLKAALGMAGK
jgi:hypothetical protein